jgi:hypothetical protein
MKTREQKIEFLKNVLSGKEKPIPFLLSCYDSFSLKQNCGQVFYKAVLGEAQPWPNGIREVSINEGEFTDLLNAWEKLPTHRQIYHQINFQDYSAQNEAVDFFERLYLTK